MTRPTARRRLGECALAGAFSGIGLTYGLFLLVSDPNSRISRWLDRNVLPYGVTRS